MNSESVKLPFDAVAMIVAGASVFEILPALAALFSILWLGVRLFEATTGIDFSQTRFAQFLSRRRGQDED